MFGIGGDQTEDLQHQSASLSPIRPKPMARSVAQQVTDATLRQLYEDILAGKTTDDIDMQQVGPEFGPT